MRKQHGVVFQAPICSLCGTELSLSRMAPNGPIHWEWYCPNEECNFEPRHVFPGEVPTEVFSAWNDPII